MQLHNQQSVVDYDTLLIMKKLTHHFKKFLPYIICAILSLLIGVARIGPPVFSPKKFLVGGWGHPDNLGNQWLLVWVAEQVWAGESIIHNDQYYLPFGDYPWLAGNGMDGFLYLPFHLLFGYPTAIPMWLLSLFVAIGFAGFALGRVMGLSRWLCLVPASIVCSTPYLVEELASGRFSQVDIFWFLGATTSFLWLFREQSQKAVFVCSLFVGMTAVFYWYYGFFFLLFACIVLLSKRVTKQNIPYFEIVFTAFGSLAVAMPMLWIFFANWHLIPGTEESVFPAPESVLTSLGFSWVVIHKYGKSAVVTQSVITVLLIGRAFWSMKSSKSRRQEVLLGSLVVLLFGLLAAGVNTPLFELLYGLASPLRRFWWPERHIVGVLVGVTILASIGLREFGRNFSVRKQFIWSLSLAVLIPFSLFVQGNRPFYAHHAPVNFPPEVYLEVAELEHDGIIQPPLNPAICRSQAPLLFQLVHKKRMLNGHAQWVDRVRPEGWDEMVLDNKFLGTFRRFEEGAFFGDLLITEEDIAELKKMGISYWVIDRELFPAGLPEVFRTYVRVLKQLFARPVVQKDGVWVFDLNDWTGEQTINLPKWSWPADVIRGTGTMGLRGDLYDSKVLLDNEKKNMPQLKRTERE